MIGAGAFNFIGPRSIRNSFARWGYPPGFHRVTGGLEMTAGLLLLIPATRAGAIGSVVILLSRLDTLAWRRRADSGGSSGGYDPRIGRLCTRPSEEFVFSGGIDRSRPRLCENSCVRFARRKFFSISSI
jgi:hypothetical protein